MEHPLLSWRASEDKSSSPSPSLPHASAVSFSLGTCSGEGDKVGQDLCGLMWSRELQGDDKSLIRFSRHQLNVLPEISRLLHWSREKKPAPVGMNESIPAALRWGVWKR